MGARGQTVPSFVPTAFVHSYILLASCSDDGDRALLRAHLSRKRGAAADAGGTANHGDGSGAQQPRGAAVHEGAAIERRGGAAFYRRGLPQARRV